MLTRSGINTKKSRDTVADRPDRAEGAQVHCLVDQEEAIIDAFAPINNLHPKLTPDAGHVPEEMPDMLLTIVEIDERIPPVRENLRELVEEAAAYSGAADEELILRRIAEQEAELELLTKQRDKLSQSKSSHRMPTTLRQDQAHEPAAAKNVISAIIMVL